MSEKKKPMMPIPAAMGLCDECIAQGKFHDKETVFQSYCEHNLFGGVFQIDLGMWRLSGPINREDFERLASALRSGIRTGKKYAAEKTVDYWAGKKWN